MKVLLNFSTFRNLPGRRRINESHCFCCTSGKVWPTGRYKWIPTSIGKGWSRELPIQISEWKVLKEASGPPQLWLQHERSGLKCRLFIMVVALAAPHLCSSSSSRSNNGLNLKYSSPIPYKDISRVIYSIWVESSSAALFSSFSLSLERWRLVFQFTVFPSLSLAKILAHHVPLEGQLAAQWGRSRVSSPPLTQLFTSLLCTVFPNGCPCATWQFCHLLCPSFTVPWPILLMNYRIQFN